MKEIFNRKKKYELIEEGYQEYRIRALRDFSDVKKGDLGGLVTGEQNLSHHGDCWIYDDASVRGNARLSGNAKVMNDADIFQNATICGDAVISGKINIGGCVTIGDAANIEIRPVFRLPTVLGPKL